VTQRGMGAAGLHMFLMNVTKKIKCPKMVFLISILRAPLILYGATIDPGMLPENIGKGHCSPSDLRSCFLACIKAINCIRFFSIWHNLAKIK